MEVLHHATPFTHKPSKKTASLALFQMRRITLLQGCCYIVDCSMGGPEFFMCRLDSVLCKNPLHIDLTAPTDISHYLHSLLKLPLILAFLTTLNFASDLYYDTILSL